MEKEYQKIGNVFKFDDETKGWALNDLETNDYYKDNPIVNYK